MLLSPFGMKRPSWGPTDELPTDMAENGAGDPGITFSYATDWRIKSTYCDGRTSHSMSAYRRHYQTQLRQWYFLFDERQDRGDPTLECEEGSEEEAILGKKGPSQVWGFSKAMPGVKYLFIKDCESSSVSHAKSRGFSLGILSSTERNPDSFIIPSSPERTIKIRQVFKRLYRRNLL